MSEYTAKRLIRDGRLVAEVEVRLHEDETGWDPTMSADDAYRMDDVRRAMREKDYATVHRLATLYRLEPVSNPARTTREERPHRGTLRVTR